MEKSTRGAQNDHSSGSSSDTECSADEVLVASNRTAADHSSNSLEYLLGHTDTITPELSDTRTPVLSHTSTPVLSHTRTPVLPHTSTPVLSHTRTSKLSHTSTSQMCHTRNQEVSHSRTPELSFKRFSIRPYNRTPEYSYPIIDMRKTHRLGSPQFHKIKVNSVLPNDLKHEVGRLFNAKPSTVNIIEEGGRKEEVLLKTIIVILPETAIEKCCTVIIETFHSMEEVHPHILCARLPVDWKVSDAKKLVIEDSGWKGLVFCKNGNVVEENLLLKDCNFGNLEKIQAVQQSSCRIEFIYQPRSNVLSTYYLEVDMTKSVKEVKKQFDTHFHDEIQKQECSKGIHFCFQNNLLEDEQCVGLILRRNIKDEKISLHFGSKNSIMVDLKFKVGRKTKHKLLIVSKDISTMSLRAEVSKHLGVDPKAVKLIFEEKLIDEHDNLGQVYREKWCSGCKIVAGVKKCKTLRIKHPLDCEEVPFEMYMLEPVSVLKRKIAEKWSLDKLQILLFCRGIQMENCQPLLHYPIKNNMEIGLRLFEHRIIVKVVILKEKKRIRIIVDNCCTSTVDDLLRFCAHHFSYARQCSRGIFKDRCLNRKRTLAEEGIQSGGTVIIAYFDQPFLLQGSLINVFMVDQGGHMVKRLGAVSSGLLLHAPKTAEVPHTEETSLDNGPVPDGINVCDNKDVCTSGASGCKLRSDFKDVSARSEKPASVKQCLKRKDELLKRAGVIKQRLCQSQTLEQLKLPSPRPEVKPSFYLSDSDTENVTGGLKSHELSLDEETGKKTVMTSKEDNVIDQCTNEEVKSKTEGLNIHGQGSEIHENVDISRDEGKDCVRGEIESDCPACNSDICQKVKCIENCCQKIKEAQSIKKQEKGSKSFHKEASFPLTNDLSGCETETSGCESARAYRPNIPARRKQKAVETDSSDIEHVTSHHGEDCLCRKCWSSGQLTRCPYLQQCHGHCFRYRKRRSIPESAVAISQLRHIQGHLPLNQTYPTLAVVTHTEPNADIETSGITVPLLCCVGNLVGTKWKQLLRKLKVDETELDSIKYQHSSAGLHELGIQALLAWKRDKGREASLVVLMKALEDTGLKSVAEHCQTLGYHTA